MNLQLKSKSHYQDIWTINIKKSMLFREIKAYHFKKEICVFRSVNAIFFQKAKTELRFCVRYVY